jgi:hypothetical protein
MVAKYLFRSAFVAAGSKSPTMASVQLGGTYQVRPKARASSSVTASSCATSPIGG